MGGGNEFPGELLTPTRSWRWHAWRRANFDAGPALEQCGDGGHVLVVEAGGGGGLVDLAHDGSGQHGHAEALGQARGQSQIFAGER